MESVEECDHIALIHKSNKLIEGKLDEVKDNLKPIVLKWAFYKCESLMYSLTQKFTGPATFKSLNNELKLEIQLECHTK
jgi:ABC-2 type transport system ATP-binding protein